MRRMPRSYGIFLVERVLFMVVGKVQKYNLKNNGDIQNCLHDPIFEFFQNLRVLPELHISARFSQPHSFCKPLLILSFASTSHMFSQKDNV